MKIRRVLWLAVIGVVVVISLGVATSSGAFDRLCQLCFATQCVDVAADANSTCIQLTNGCIAFGECSAGLTITP